MLSQDLFSAEFSFFPSSSQMPYMYMHCFNTGLLGAQAKGLILFSG
jgi:hypothetical protein